MNALKRLCYLSLGVALLLASTAASAQAAGAVADKYRWLTFTVFGAIIALTMGVTYWAAKQTHTTSEFYAAGRSVSGIQNGWAIAGDYLSAASFLGIAGLISLYGYDGFMYSVGWLVAYITVLLVIAKASATSASTPWATSWLSAMNRRRSRPWRRCPPSPCPPST